MTNDQRDWTSVVARPQVQLAGSPWAYPAADTTMTFPLEPDTSIVGVLLPDFPNVTELTIKGHVSGVTYLTADPTVLKFPSSYYAIIQSAVDTSVDITINAGFANTAYISSIPDPVAAVSVPENPAPWQAPNQPGIAISFANPGAGNTAVIIAAPVNAQSIWLHSMSWEWTVASTTANGRFIDGAGHAVGKDTPVAVGQGRYMDFKGIKLGPGVDFHFIQDGAAAASTTSCFGFLTYSVF